MKVIMLAIIKAVSEKFVTYDYNKQNNTFTVLRSGIEYKVSVSFEEISRADYAGNFLDES